MRNKNKIMETRIDFNPNESPLKRRMADGHFNRTGHALTGYFIEKERALYSLVHTCGC